MIAATLSRTTSTSHLYPRVMKEELQPGDWVVIHTLTSEYRLRVLSDGMVEARGGWFDRKGRAPMRIGVSGATWGGCAILPRVLAACGMSMEFKNRLITSQVRTIVVWPAKSQN